MAEWLPLAGFIVMCITFVAVPIVTEIWLNRS